MMIGIEPGTQKWILVWAKLQLMGLKIWGFIKSEQNQQWFKS
jgi:hypothetical protein